MFVTDLLKWVGQDVNKSPRNPISGSLVQTERKILSCASFRHENAHRSLVSATCICDCVYTKRKRAADCAALLLLVRVYRDAPGLVAPPLTLRWLFISIPPE